MTIIFIRAVILLLSLIVIMRLMGKRQIGEMQPYEFIITLLIAELACVPMADVSIPLIYGIVSVLAVFILHQLLTLLEQAGSIARLIISGKPSIVINKDGVDVKELKKNNMGVEDLLESLRNTGNFSFDSVHYAIYEANGNLSVLESQNKQIDGKLPLLLVSEGKIVKNNFQMINLDKSFLDGFLKEQNIKALRDVEVLTLESSGKVYLKVKEQKFKTFNIDLGENVNW